MIHSGILKKNGCVAPDCRQTEVVGRGVDEGRENETGNKLGRMKLGSTDEYGFFLFDLLSLLVLLVEGVPNGLQGKVRGELGRLRSSETEYIEIFGSTYRIYSSVRDDWERVLSDRESLVDELLSSSPLYS